MHALIVGGSGGIGQALVQQLCASAAVDSVTATCFRNAGQMVHDKLIWHRVDVTSEPDVKALLDSSPEIDLLINTVGFLHDGEWTPEKTVKQIDPRHFLRCVEINTLPTLLLAKYAAPRLRRGERPCFATLSAKVGSIEDNRLGGWYSYRCAKAALNMALKNVSIEWQRSLPRVVVAGLHPGTTDTMLSKPFQRNVPAAKLFTTTHAAECLLSVIRGLEPKDTGRLWNWDGKPLPW